MTLILTMAGLYKRFKNEGYVTPKFLLKLQKNQTILEEILRELTCRYDFENVICIANKKDSNYSKDILDVVGKVVKRNYYIHFVDDTRGQAETALLGIHFLKSLHTIKSKKIAVHNIDTILYNRDFEKIDLLLESNDGFIDVFQENKDHFSFVKVDRYNQVLDIQEKVVISDKATSGLYCFKDFEEYENIYKAVSFQGEYYISAVYQSMLKNHKKIVCNALESCQKTIILGTPYEYETYLQSENS